MRYCGRDFSDSEFEGIRQLINDHPKAKRALLSRLEPRFSRPLPKQSVTCSYSSSHSAMTRTYTTSISIATTTLDTSLSQGPSYAILCSLTSAFSPSSASGPPPGKPSLGIASSAGLLGSENKAFTLWSNLVVNNARFLILPWVRCHNLASCILAMASRRIARDWHSQYGYRPVLLETFVEQPRFRGTCYQADNWILVGETKGRGKLDRHNEAKLPKKAIGLYPLVRNFRDILSP